MCWKLYVRTLVSLSSGGVLACTGLAGYKWLCENEQTLECCVCMCVHCSFLLLCVCFWMLYCEKGAVKVRRSQLSALPLPNFSYLVWLIDFATTVDCSDFGQWFQVDGAQTFLSRSDWDRKCHPTFIVQLVVSLKNGVKQQQYFVFTDISMRKFGGEKIYFYEIDLQRQSEFYGSEPLKFMETTLFISL